MYPPFSTAQFLDAFRRYHAAVDPTHWLSVVVALVVVGAALRGSRGGARVALGLLALLWLWMAVAFHLAFFTTVSPLGYLFAGLFAAEALLLARAAVRPPRLEARPDARGIVAAVLLVYALVGYPLAALAVGHRFPAVATFGLPCPTTIFTLGVLLLAVDAVPVSIVIIPIMWAVIGGSAVPLLGMWEDVGLIFAGLAALPLLAPRRTTIAQRSTTALIGGGPRSEQHHRVRTASRWLGGIAGAMLVAYLAYAAAAWLRYGHDTPRAVFFQESTLDRYIPAYEVREVHEARVAASPSQAFAAACAFDLNDSRVVRAIFAGRELMMQGRRSPAPPRRPFLHEISALGWGMLSATTGRELVYGAVAKPWEGDVHFRALPATEFAGFTEPGYAKIVWSIGVESDGASGSIVRTETRVATTDPVSRRRFRRYWAFLSPGIVLIRREALGLVKQDAERERNIARVAPPLAVSSGHLGRP